MSLDVDIVYTHRAYDLVYADNGPRLILEQRIGSPDEPEPPLQYVPEPPAEGTYRLESVDGVITWVEI